MLLPFTLKAAVGDCSVIPVHVAQPHTDQTVDNATYASCTRSVSTNGT